MRPLASALRFVLAASALGLSACLFGGDGDAEDSLTTATLGETGLVGRFDLFDFKVEYGDGTVIDTSWGKITGIVEVAGDSAYVQRIWVGVAPTDTRGRITAIRAESKNRARGELTLTLEGNDRPGLCTFDLRGDTLNWVTEVDPSKDGKRIGFKETGRYLRARE